MKKIAQFLFSSAFIVYLVIAIDFFPFEMHFNILDWNGKRLGKFIIVFLIVLFFCRGDEFEQLFNKKKKPTKSGL